MTRLLAATVRAVLLLRLDEFDLTTLDKQKWLEEDNFVHLLVKSVLLVGSKSYYPEFLLVEPGGAELSEPQEERIARVR